MQITINWNKYQSKVTIQESNSYLDYLNDPSFQGVNRPFVLSFKNDGDRAVHTKSYFPTVEMKDYILMIDKENFFDHPVKNDLKYDNIWKIPIGQGDDDTTGSLFQRLLYDDRNRFK